MHKRWEKTGTLKAIARTRLICPMRRGSLTVNGACTSLKEVSYSRIINHKVFTLSFKTRQNWDSDQLKGPAYIVDNVMKRIFENFASTLT